MEGNGYQTRCDTRAAALQHGATATLGLFSATASGPSSQEGTVSLSPAWKEADTKSGVVVLHQVDNSLSLKQLEWVLDEGFSPLPFSFFQGRTAGFCQ